MELRKIRKKTKLKQCQVAQALGLTPQIYSRYERGEREPSFEILIKMADFFGVTVDELLGRTSEPQLFDNARIERPEILDIFAQLTPAQQENLLNYGRGMLTANELAQSTTKGKSEIA